MMWWAMTVILLALWVLGLVSGAALGGWIHLFFAFATVSGLLALTSGAGRRSGAAR